MDTKNTIDIFGMLEAKTLDGILALAQQIYDKEIGLMQGKVNELSSVKDDDGNVRKQPLRIVKSDMWVYAIEDCNGNMLLSVNRDGEVWYKKGMSDEVRRKFEEIANRLKELSGWKITENEQYMFLITDSANNLLFGINRNGEMECDKGMSREVRERLDELRGWQVKRNEQFVFLVTDKKQNLLLGIRRGNGRLVVPHGFIEVVTEKEYEETEIENDVLYAIKGKGGRIVDLCLNGQPIRNSEEHFFSKEDNILMYNGHMTVMPRIYIDHDEMMLMVEYPTGYEGPLFENVDGMLFVRN
jgi:hypothetical protein